MIGRSPFGAPTVTGRWKRISRIPDLNNRYACWSNYVFGTYVACQNGYTKNIETGLIPTAFLNRASICYNGMVEMNGTATVAGSQMPFTFEDGEW